MKQLQPVILGSGSAARAMRLALAMYPEEIAPARQLHRDEPLPDPDPERSLVVLANPHGLHTPRLVEAAERGYRWAICEKPAAVHLEQVAQLEELDLSTWICHGYRMLWGPGELRRMWAEGELGEVMTIEGRYWQAGVVRGPAKNSWKDDPALGGRHDVLIDLASHWADLMIYLTATAPERTEVRQWYLNAPSEHRDTHVHLRMEHGSTTSFGSISKTVHGAGNHLELHVLGARATASWTFSDPDVITLGRQHERTTRVRTDARPPARLAPFHSMGWLEGYGALVGDLVDHVCHGIPRRGPSLPEQTTVLRALLTATV